MTGLEVEADTCAENRWNTLKNSRTWTVPWNTYRKYEAKMKKADLMQALIRLQRDSDACD